MRKNASIIWEIPYKELIKVVNKSNTISEILRIYGLQNKGRNSETLKKRLYKENINFSHIPLGVHSNKGRYLGKDKIPLQEILDGKHPTYSRNHLKERLLKKGILKNKCEICGLNNIWNNKKIIMILDHVNGISDDHRLENLRMLCPNCNSQQDTFCRGTYKAKEKRNKKQYFKYRKNEYIKSQQIYI